MTNQNANISLGKASKVAGLTYVIIIIIGVLKVNFLESALIMQEHSAATANNIMANQLLFRIGILSEIVMFVLVVVLSLALYVILKPVNRNLALTALFLRFGEGIIGAVVTVISGLIPLLLLNSKSVFEPEQLQALVGIFLNVRIAGLDIVLIFIGLGGTVYLYLFYVSKYVPRILAGWGIFTYLSMLILSMVSILFPNHPEMIEIVLYSVGGLFELVFGLWLLIKGVNMQGENDLLPASP